MNDLLKKHLEAQLPKEIGKTYEVLVEKYDPDTGLCSGRTRNFMEVIFPGELGDEGQFLDVKISLNNSFQLFGDKI
ncbi:MAG: TRAM domain-containing protein [Patescibacteria group bacterium]|nr:TRAM domain-containing protein [Patescibacteria group bacterium]